MVSLESKDQNTSQTQKLPSPMFFSQILIDIVNQTAVEFCGKMHHYVSSPFMAHFCTFLGTSLLSLLQLFMGQYPPKLILFVFPEDSLGQKRGNKSNSCGTCYTYAKGVTPPPLPRADTTSSQCGKAAGPFYNRNDCKV